MTFELDPSNTKIDFTLGDILHTVHGTFKAKSGVVHFDLSSGMASGSIIVDATSGSTANKPRDHKMHHEVLESDKYPEIIFTPTRITGTVGPVGNSRVQIAGVFQIQGRDHPLTLEVPLHVDGSTAAGTVKFVVPYVAWGIKDPSTFVLRVSKEVEIDVEMSGRLTPAAPGK